MHKPYALPKLLKSRSVWDYPSLIDIYALLKQVQRDRTIDDIESFELLLPAFPDMHIRSFAYQSLISRFTSYDLLIYLPQLLQIIKFDYTHSSVIIKYLLEQSLSDHRLAHKLYWHLRQLLITEHLHYIRYYYLFLSLLYILEESFREELHIEYDLCLNLKQIGLKLKSSKASNKGNILIDQLKEVNTEFFRSGKVTCRLPCQFNFMTNSLDISSCSFFNSLTVPIKLVFNPTDSSCEKYYAIYKIGDDLRVSRTRATRTFLAHACDVLFSARSNRSATVRLHGPNLEGQRFRFPSKSIQCRANTGTLRFHRNDHRERNIARDRIALGNTQRFVG